MFFHDGKVVFSLFIILIKFSRFTFCSCDSVCLWLFGCALFGYVVFPFFEVGGIFLLDCFLLFFLFFFFFLLILDVCGTILLSCSSFIFSCISSISRSENQTFFFIGLTWSASLWLVIWKLVYSCQISITLFLNPLGKVLLLKYQCSAS